MKTNQLMQVRISDYVQPINHKSMMGNLNTLWDFGNSLRELKGKMPLRVDKFLLSPDTVEFMLELEKRVNPPNRGIIKVEHRSDDSGTEYNILKDAIDLYLPKRDGKDNLGVYIQIATRIRSKINPDGGEWNTANHAQLERRTHIEKSLVQLL